MKQTPARRRHLTPLLIPGRIAEKEDSFLDRDQEKLDKFIHSEWLCQSQNLRGASYKRVSTHQLFLWFSLWSGGRNSSLDLGKMAEIRVTLSRTGRHKYVRPPLPENVGGGRDTM